MGIKQKFIVLAGIVGIILTIVSVTGYFTAYDNLSEAVNEEIVANEKIVVHDCDNSPLVHIGTLPSGGDLIINKLVVDADLVCSEGFIEPMRT